MASRSTVRSAVISTTTVINLCRVCSISGKFDTRRAAFSTADATAVAALAKAALAPARVAVLEMGMNHAGEIRVLARMARPDIGVVTNVGYAHVEAFDSIEAVALAKRELIEELPPDGVAVLNADDPLVAAFREVHSGRSVTFGLSENADVRAEGVELGAAEVRFHYRGVAFESLNTTVLFGLATALSTIVTGTVWVVWPAAKLSVPVVTL